VLRDLSPELVTHSASYGDASHLRGRKVLVVGAGASATNIAALLLAKGVEATLMTRRPVIRFPSPWLRERSLYDRLRYPMNGLGPGWKRRHLGPSPAWFMRNAFEGHVPLITRSRILKAEAKGSGVHLQNSS
jgi:hypothetical protein